MNQLAAVVVTLALSFSSTSVLAATPQFGTKEGELACVGLMNLGLSGASTSQLPEPRVVNAIAMALGFYLGRLNKVDPGVKKQDIDRALAGLTLEEKNSYANLCIGKAGELMAPTLG